MSAVLHEGWHTTAQGRTERQRHRPVSASVLFETQFPVLALHVNTQSVGIYWVILLQSKYF
jgi:hypothetical protein